MFSKNSRLKTVPALKAVLKKEKFSSEEHEELSPEEKDE